MPGHKKWRDIKHKKRVEPPPCTCRYFNPMNGSDPIRMEADPNCVYHLWINWQKLTKPPTR